MSGSRFSQAQSGRLGIPAGFGTFTAFPFAGLNQQAARTAMADQQFYWLENYIRVGDGNLRALWDVGTPLYTGADGAMLPFVCFYNIGEQAYFAVFKTDGTATQVSYPDGARTHITTAAGTFYDASTEQLPAAVQSGTKYLLICNNNTDNGYWIWDGAVLYGAGSIAPFSADELTSGGSGYTSAPAVTVFGGSGSGVVLTPVISGGSVVSLTVRNPGSGYLPGEIVQARFSGGGSDDGAILTAVLSPQSIDHISLIDGGSGFADGTYALAFAGGGGGVGAAATYTCVNGTVVSIFLSASGSGYTATPTVSFPSGGGSGASAIVILTPATLASVTVVNGGSGYEGTPVLEIRGGGGNLATAVAVMSGGAIASVTVVTAGSGFTSTPAVIVQAGVNDAASAILSLMPFGVSGTTIETYQQRVWIAFPHQEGTELNGGTMLVSGPNSLTNFSVAQGGVIRTNTDRFLRKKYVFLRQTSNFLYASGDSSTSVISNVQTSGAVPPLTTFSYQNTDPQVGGAWRDSAGDYGNTILFGNSFGVWGLYGGAVRKQSDAVDNLFTSRPTFRTALVPTGACANIFNQKAYLLLMTIIDPLTFRPRNVMLGFDGQSWFIASQTPSLTAIGTLTIESNLQAWGTDGTSLYQLFAVPSEQLVKSISTKQWGGANSMLVNSAHSLYIDAEDVSQGQNGLTFMGTVDAVGQAAPFDALPDIQSTPSGSVPIDTPMGFLAPRGNGAVFACRVPQVPGIGLGVTLASSSPDFVLRNLTLGYVEMAALT